MYTRSVNFPNGTENEGNIPENYSGYTMSRNQQGEEAQKPDMRENPQIEADEDTLCSVQSEEREERSDDFSSDKSAKPFSGLLEKIGIKGAESSDVTVLILALLLLGGENDDYIWILLLLLLLVK